MKTILAKETEDFCKSIGLKGRQVASIKSVIGSQEDLSKFKNFIIENDGKFKSNLELVYKFLNSSENSYSYDEFEKEYHINKVDALRKISKGFYSNEVLHKVETLVENGLTLESIYSKVTSEDINILQVLNLLKKDVDNS